MTLSMQGAAICLLRACSEWRYWLPVLRLAVRDRGSWASDTSSRRRPIVRRRHPIWVCPAAWGQLGLRFRAWWWWLSLPSKLVSRSNKGGGPRVSRMPSQRSAWCMPYWSGRSVEFQKAPLANSTRDIMPRDCWIGRDSVVRTHLFSGHLVSKGAWQNSVICCHHWTYLTDNPRWRQRRRMTCKLSFWGLVAVVWVFAAMRNLLGDLWLVAVTSARGWDNTGEVRWLNLAGWKPKVWP
jgi:hypothetical protein